MALISQFSRISHHTVALSATTSFSGKTFTVPGSEDFTLGGWTIYDLALSEIGVDEFRNKAYIRIGNNINEFNFGTGGTSTTIIQQFTGNTSASCISNLYVSNIYGCSPITIHDSIKSVGSTASGLLSTAFGNTTEAQGDYSHSEGEYTIAQGHYSHAEGSTTSAIGEASHAEGITSQSSGFYSHAEGRSTQSNGEASHSEGSRSVAGGNYSHAGGYQSYTLNYAEFARSSSNGGTNYGQHGIFTMYGNSTTSGSVGMYFGDGTVDVLLIDNSAYRFDVKGVAISDTGALASFDGSVTLKKVGGLITFCPSGNSQTINSVCGDMSGASITFITGISGTTFRGRYLSNVTGNTTLNASFHYTQVYKP